MGIATADDIAAERRSFLKRMKREDEQHAALFCPTCTAYIGAATPCKECNPLQQDTNCTCNDERPGDCRSFGCDPDCEVC